MTQFKYPHFLLGTVVAGLWFVGDTYATQSPLTPGPSVGHRPVMTNLVLATKVGPANGVITDSAAILYVGSTIELLSAAGGPGGVDVDGDEDKAGAYCVWYKVPAGGGTPVLIQDRGPTDRNCHYVIQTSDIGFKIKADVTIFSNADKALAQGYTINPIESAVATQISLNTVKKPPYIKGIKNVFNNTIHPPTGVFPQTLVRKQSFQVIIDNGLGTEINNEYSWSISDATAFSISNDGRVTVNGVPAYRNLTIEAKALDGSGVLTHEVKPAYYVMASKTSHTRFQASSWCQQQGMELATAYVASLGFSDWRGGLNASTIVWVGNSSYGRHNTYNLGTGKMTETNENVGAGVVCDKYLPPKK